MKNVTIYTDGACSINPGPGGYGAVLFYKGNKKEVSCGYRLTTNNRMELLAVIRGLEMLKEPCIVDLYSDSKYVIDAINKKWVYGWEKKKWQKSPTEKRINYDLWIRLLELLKIHQVNFIWVRGHAGNVYNERCDFLATQAVRGKELLTDEHYESSN